MRTEEDLQKEAAQERKRKSWAAQIVELQGLIMFYVVYSYGKDHFNALESDSIIIKIVFFLIAAVLFAIGVIFIWATIVHMNEYNELKKKNEKD